jgi:heptose I phosphotransferase
MTKGLDGHVALDQYIGEHFAPPLDVRRRGEKRRLIAAAARLTRHFHWLGFNHRDYYLCHLFVRPGDDNENDLRIIDLQRVGYHMPFRARWIVKDLAALHYSSLGLPLTDRDRLRFYALYSCGQRDRKRQLKWVLRKSAAIARHDLRLRQSNEQGKSSPPKMAQAR